MVCFSATFSLSGTYRCWKQRQHKLLAPCQQSRLCRVGSLCRAQCPNYRGADCKAETCKPLHANMFQQGKQHTWQKAQLGRSPANFAQVLSSSLGAAEGHLSAMGSHCLSALTDESRPFSCHNSCSDQARLIKYSVPASSSSLSQQWGVTLVLENPASVNITMQSLLGSLHVILLSTFSVMTSLCSLLCIKYR